MPGLNKEYNQNKLEQTKKSHWIGLALLNNGLETEAVQYYVQMLNNVYGCGGNNIQGGKYLSQLGINPEAPEFVPAKLQVNQVNQENIDITGESSHSYSDQDGH